MTKESTGSGAGQDIAGASAAIAIAIPIASTSWIPQPPVPPRAGTCGNFKRGDQRRLRCS
jgi:hypothetical protein